MQLQPALLGALWGKSSMPKKARELGALEVGRLKDPGLHAVGGVAGLHLQVDKSGARSWILRVTIGDRRPDMGLGGYPDVTLAGAREAARAARAKIKAGVDPLAEARKARSALKAATASAWTLRACGEGYIAAKESEWKNAKHAAQWANTLATYAYPKIGDLQVRDVDLPQVLSVVEPIWTTKTETAKRLRNRIELVLDWATVRSYRHGPNPARWRGHLDKLLPKPSKVARVVHHPALPVADVGAFMQALGKHDGMGARALEFTILTACRSGEARGATWHEIDLDDAAWTIPAARMKSDRPHRVPLSPAALALLRALPHKRGDVLVFPSSRGTPLSDMTLTAVLRRMKVNAVPHGFRSTFRDWASERSNFPSDVAEMALAHAIGDATEAAYRRGDLFDKRRRMMTAWAEFCAKAEAKKGAVVSLAEKRA
jgi:integrase